MKKNYFLWAIMLFATTTFAQKALILNEGKWGDPSENANLLIYDIQSKQYSQIDTIYTSSVQELLIDGDDVYVAAQNSILKYNLVTESRIAAAAFPGVSTKDLNISNNELWVSNFYGQDSNNIYVFDKSNLSFIDSLPAVTREVGSMVSDQNYLYATQNSPTSTYTDTLGIILKIDLTTKAIVDTLSFASYTEDIGQLIIHDNKLFSFNSYSNTVGVVDLINQQKTLRNSGLNITVGSKSNYSLFADTIFVQVSGGIAAINLSDLSVIDSKIVDTVITAFSYDTVNYQFYISQTDFYSYNKGAIYSRTGQKVDTLQVGFSPEGMRIYYNQQVGLADKQRKQHRFKVYPNPAKEMIQFELSENVNTVEMKIFNQLGALVKTQNINPNQVINISELSKGIYFVLLQSKDNYGMEKLIVD